MAEEVLKIVIDGGAGPAPSGGGATATPGSPAAPAATPAAAFDPMREAQRRLDRELREMSIQREMDKIQPPTLGEYVKRAGFPGGKAIDTIGKGILGEGGYEKVSASLGPQVEKLVGPIALAALALEGIKRAANMATSAITGMSEITSRAARGDNIGAILKTGEAFQGLVGMIPTVGPALATITGPALAVASGLKALTDAFLARAQELMMFSPVIVEAETKAQIRQMGADMREAEQLGPDMARLIDAESELRMVLQDTLIPIKKVVLEILVPIIQNITTEIRVIASGVNLANELIQIVIDLMKAFFSGRMLELIDVVKNVPDRITNAVKRAWEEKEGGNDLIENVEKIFNSFPPSENRQDAVLAGEAARANMLHPLVPGL